jgi:hypothetical protein
MFKAAGSVVRPDSVLNFWIDVRGIVAFIGPKFRLEISPNAGNRLMLI